MFMLNRSLPPDLSIDWKGEGGKQRDQLGDYFNNPGKTWKWFKQDGGIEIATEKDEQESKWMCLHIYWGKQGTVWWNLGYRAKQLSKIPCQTYRGYKCLSRRGLKTHEFTPIPSSSCFHTRRHSSTQKEMMSHSTDDESVF